MKHVFYLFIQYFRLVKILQTTLLVLTGLTGYLSASGASITDTSAWRLLASLFLSISGSTILNMVIDRDLDAKMKRTENRPLPSGCLDHKEAFIFGAVLSGVGLFWAVSLSMTFGVIVFTGWLINVALYSLKLKRKTHWSILWGGISGSMPILAGRVLASERIDLIGILLALSILLWIPIHIMTFNMKYLEDYNRAGVPTFPSRYGFQATRWTIALSSFGAAISIGIGAFALGLSGGFLWTLAGLSIGILALALLSLIQPSERINFGLFKFASLYIIGAMILLILGT